MLVTSSSCARYYIFLTTLTRQRDNWHRSIYSKVLHSHRIISRVVQVSSTCTLTGHLCFLDGLLCFLAPPPLHKQVHSKESGSVKRNDNLQRQKGNVTITMTRRMIVINVAHDNQSRRGQSSEVRLELWGKWHSLTQPVPISILSHTHHPMELEEVKIGIGYARL